MLNFTLVEFQLWESPGVAEGSRRRSGGAFPLGMQVEVAFDSRRQHSFHGRTIVLSTHIAFWLTLRDSLFTPQHDSKRSMLESIVTRSSQCFRCDSVDAVSNAMEGVQVEWETLTAAEGGARALLLESSQPPLESPVSPRHSRASPSLVAAIVVLMVLATTALICCCYMWEQQLRLRIEGRNNNIEPSSSSSTSLQDPVAGGRSQPAMVSGSSTVIVLLGDDIPRSVAWAFPHQGIPAVAPPNPQAAPHPTTLSNRHTTEQSLVGKLAPT